MKKGLLISGIGVLLLLSVISAQETEPAAENIPLGIPPTIDGIISSGEWIAANTKPVELESDDGETKNAEMHLEYDNETFYFALVVEGESEEVYLWLGDDESLAFQEGTDLKRCQKSNNYTCSDWYYRGLYDFVEDDHQDVTGAGSYDVETDKTTVELEIPFNSGDANDYQIDCSKVFIIIFGSIHRSSPDKEYKVTKPVAYWAEYFTILGIQSVSDAQFWEDQAERARKEGKCYLAAEYFLSARLAWRNAATAFRNAAAKWDKEAEYLRKAEKDFREVFLDNKNANKADERATAAERKATGLRQTAGECDANEVRAQNNATAAQEETVKSQPKPEESEESEEKGRCLGTLFIVLSVIGGSIIHFIGKRYTKESNFT